MPALDRHDAVADDVVDEMTMTTVDATSMTRRCLSTARLSAG
jgi:hypothetical protein